MLMICVNMQYLFMRGTLRTRAITQNSSCVFWVSLKVLKSIQNSQDLYNMCKWYRLLHSRIFISSYISLEKIVLFHIDNETNVGRGLGLDWLHVYVARTQKWRQLAYTLLKRKLTQVKGLHLLGLFNGSSICVTNWPMISILWI